MGLVAWDAELKSLWRQQNFPDLGKGNLNTMPVEEIRGLRRQVLASAKRMLDVCERENRNLDSEQQRVYDQAMGLIEFYDRKAELREKSPAAKQQGAEIRSAEGATWRTAEGVEVRSLAPGESFAEAVRSTGGEAYPGLTLGGLCRAMALGPRSDVERRALAEGSDSAGGASVPIDLLSRFIDLMRAKSTVIRAGTRTIPLATLQTSIARLTGDPSTTWHAENTADFAASDLTFDKVTFTAKTLIAHVRSSRELLDDSLNADEIISTALAAAMAGELDRAALYGTGLNNQPKGLTKITNVLSVSMGDNGAALANFDPLVDGLQKLEDANAEPPTAMILAPRTSAEISKLKDTTDQPLQMPDVLRGIPRLVTSKVPVNETQGSANNASRIVLGNFADLMIGMRAELRLEVMRERYGEYFQYGFLAWLRCDVQAAHPESFCQIVGIIPPTP
jgi:HK97 family phage major capsid protein